MPEYLQKRFQSQWVRTYLTAVALISYVFTKTSVCHIYLELQQPLKFISFGNKTNLLTGVVWLFTGGHLRWQCIFV